MRTFQREFGPSIVIELPKQPVDRVVTAAAVVRVSFFVRVFVTMTVDAEFRRILERVGLMAIVAFRFCMLTQQRKEGERMIEEHIFLPGILVVTVLASDALLAIVRIVVHVAVIACCL